MSPPVHETADGRSATLVSLQFIGPFEVKARNGGPIILPGRRSVALLACIAENAEQAWSRERLARLIWAGRGGTQARNSLRQELVRIRRALTDALGADLQLWKGRQGLFLPNDIFDTDLVRLSGAVRDPMRAGEAAELYRGELLEDYPADDTPFGTWLADRRHRLRQSVIGCLLEALSRNEAAPQAGASAGDADPRELRLAQRLLELEPWCEDAHRWVMQFHLRRGDEAKAVRQYQLCEEALRSAVGTAPSAATFALISHIAVPRPVYGRAAQRSGGDEDWIAWVKGNAPSPLAPPPRRLAPIEDRPALVVLPFADIAAGGAADGVLALGLTEETTDSLTRLSGFFVTARHSAMAYVGASDVRRIAAELGVRYLVEGSVLHDARRLRVHIRLIDGRSGSSLWSDTHEGPLAGLMELRDSVVRQIAGRLLPELQFSEIQLALNRVPADLDAWGWLQRANAVLASRSRETALADALPPLRRALEIDPNYRMAHALVGAVRTWRASSQMFPEADEDRRLARAHAQEALLGEEKDSFVLAHCGEVALYSAGDINEAKRLLDKAVARNPSDPWALAMAANAKRFAGDNPAQSLALLDEAMRLSPRDPRTFGWEHYTNWCYCWLGDYEAMEAAARRSIELYSRFPWSWLSLVCALGLQGRRLEAARAAAEMLQVMPQFSPTAFYETARIIYGPRFGGAIEARYTGLREILERALAEIGGGS